MMCVSLAGAAQAISPATQPRLLSRPLHHGHPLTTISASPSSHCPRRSSLPLTPAVASRPRTVTAAASEAVAAEAAAAAEALEALLDAPEIEYEEKELGFAYRKPRLALKFIWREKNIGVALDQVIHGHGNVPLSPYYFWPRKDAWEELKAVLESKPWITQKRVIILLNQATDIINLWQQSGAGSLQQ